MSLVFRILKTPIFMVVFNDGFLGFNAWQTARGLSIAICTVQAASTLILCVASWRLYHEFAWQAFEQVNADIQMRRKYYLFQFLMALLKFDGFFFLGFMVQYIILTPFIILWTVTLVVIIVTFILFFMSAWVFQKEQFWAGIRVIMYTPLYSRHYSSAILNLTLFGVLALLLSVITIVIMVMCLMNFDKGLKPYIANSRKVRELEELEMELEPLSAYSSGQYEEIQTYRETPYTH
ncbi:hypothetical protein ASPZODRAFT_146437 [Penicilliopsis zonata CBS 506.65]|uniref:Uncharacterized protein n=1 Tax=Penicilliopsis zonata CBS 506.65 TaxID=1073090 RepID=A0A1L9S7J5_9EURO|nr:hypothetical protein ASPZODRAFT_146437 [Penicilliopsis zonata CBS 506.65]OJJ43147.1 hypothetical protein ASPZODRAFT_146437 [Penicilliopsis zonata CBS 506.65]